MQTDLALEQVLCARVVTPEIKELGVSPNVYTVLCEELARLKSSLASAPHSQEPGQ